MQIDELSSSQEFIRALKAPRDPPKPGGIRKVDLARQAWELESLFIPSKAEVIAEWALQTLLSSGQTESGVLDEKTWRLLADIVCTHGTTLNSTLPWLNGVVNRVPVLPIFTSLLHALRKEFRADAPGPTALLDAATNASHVLLPLASLKTNCDTIAACFWEVLGLFSAREIPDPPLCSALAICKTVVSVFETSFGNYSNKKKIATFLADNHLSSFLLLPVGAEPETLHDRHPPLTEFRHKLFDVGCSIVFSPEHTRAIFQHPDTHPILLATTSCPRIFPAYVSALRTHKLSVFLDQGNSAGGLAKRIRGAARQLYARSVAERNDWSVIARLSQSSEELQVVDDDWADEFGSLVESAVRAFDNKWSDEQAQIAIHICSTLACILRLHVEVVEPYAERLLSGLCDAPSTVLGAAGSVFDLLLEYHSKARTLHTFLPRLAHAFTPRLSLTTSREFYRATCTGPVFDAAFVARLRRSVSAFMTPGQMLPCTQQLLSQLSNLLATLLQNPEPPRKKRRILSSSSEPGRSNEPDEEARAVQVSLSSRLLVHILSSLPVKTLKPEVLEQLRTSIDEFEAGVLSDTLNGLANAVGQSWERQIVLAAVLRIRYGLRHSRSPIQTARIPVGEGAAAEDTLLLRIIEDADVSAELVTEVVRVLTQGQRSSEHIRNIWNLALSRVQRDSADQQDKTWNGSLAHLEDHVWFPLLFLLFDRHLHLIEASLTAEQLKTVLDLLVNMNRNLESSGLISAPRLFNKTLAMAQFWEMPNLRKALNDKIIHDTSSLDQVDLHKALKTMRKGKLSKHAGSHDAAISMYHIAALAPPDYLDRSVKSALLARAPCADVLSAWPKDRAVVRVVLRQMSSGSIGALPEEYVRYLLDPQLQYISEAMGDSYNSTDDTLSILGASFRVYARLVKETGAQGDLVAVLRSIETLRLFELPLWEDPKAMMSIRAVLSCLDTTVEICGTQSTLPDETRTCVAKILDQIRNRVEQVGNAPDVLIEAARTLAVCERRLNRDTTQASRRARRFLRTLLEQNSVATEALLRLLTEEIQNADEDVCLLLAAFALNARTHNNDTLRSAENSFGEACRRITSEQHGILMNEIVSLLLEPETDHAHRVATIRMASLAIRFAPEGTSKARRRSTTAVLHALGRLPQLSVFQEACTVFVAEICNDRANALTAPDMSAIWVLLDRATSSADEIFQRTYSSIVFALNCLVRFRRDLLTPTLAQLSALLARLIRGLRLRTSHTIGALQRNAESQAGRATELARLLVGLSTKSVVRVSSKPEQTAKAESLARPFARHAPYVLVAYAESAADMSAAVRNTLKPGLFALCTMCGVPARDMIMVTMLDTVEKEVFVSVWREWEAQKYTGKG